MMTCLPRTSKPNMTGFVRNLLFWKERPRNGCISRPNTWYRPWVDHLWTTSIMKC